jgi:carboxylesterase type B
MSLLLYVALLACAITSTFAQDVHTVGKTPSATVLNGTYIGIHSSSNNQDYFLGIPFARPPVGALRFRTPQPVNSKWARPREVTTYSAACVGYGDDELAYPSLSEDCLYLNIVRPSGYSNQKLPVGLWIHGGAYYMGSSIDQRYNLSRIVQQSVAIDSPFIGVSINYRVSVWGFLSSEEVLESGQTNLGLRDQRLALEWVQENIAAFGGE